MSIDRLDKILSVFGQGLSLLITVACIALAGIICWVALSIAGYGGIALYALSTIGALVGGVIVRLVLRVLLVLTDGH